MMIITNILVMEMMMMLLVKGCSQYTHLRDSSVRELIRFVYEN